MTAKYALVWPMVAAAVLAQSRGPTLGQAPASGLAPLRQKLQEYVSEPRFAQALWGVKIVSLETGQTIFEQNAQKLFSPASNSKLFTVALALERLGPDYRIPTTVYGTAKPSRRGVLRGDLILYGRGDPTFTSRLYSGGEAQVLEALVSIVTNAGIRRITGDLVGDESYFRGPPFGSGWAWDDLEYSYGAEISALTFDDNLTHVLVRPAAKVGLPCRIEVWPEPGFFWLSNRTQTADAGASRSVEFYRPWGEPVIYATGRLGIDSAPYAEDLPVPHPARWFVSNLREALKRAGVRVTGRARTVDWLERRAHPQELTAPVDLGSASSLSLREVAREVLKPSQNLYADLLLAHVGERSRGPETPPSETSESLGVAELGRFALVAGVPAGELVFEEGSGLSRNNLASPNATVVLLEYMSRHRCAEPFLEALPIAGVDGTLRNRMRDTIAAGNVRAKTGTLRWANALSGYLTTAAGERVAFSFYLNRYQNGGPENSARVALDALAVMVAGCTERTGQAPAR